jgi:hypothetical protein
VRAEFEQEDVFATIPHEHDNCASHGLAIGIHTQWQAHMRAALPRGSFLRTDAPKSHKDDEDLPDESLVLHYGSLNVAQSLVIQEAQVTSEAD